MAMPRDPDARRYYRAGKQRLAEAELILRQVKLPAASVYLAGYGVECLLKALLVERTPDAERPELIGMLKARFGHSVTRLRAGLARRGVRGPAGVALDLAVIASWSPDLRYEPGPGKMASAELFMRAATRVVAWADGRI